MDASFGRIARWSVAAVILVSAAAPSFAVQAILRLEPLSPLPAESSAFHLHAQEMKPNALGEPRTLICAAGKDCEIELPEGTWVFSSGDPRLYVFPKSEPLSSPQAEAPVISLRASPAVAVHGVSARPKKLDRVSIEFQTADPKGPKGRVHCPVVESRWSCVLPAGTWDLKVAAPGHIAGYRWDIELRAGVDKNLGDVAFHAGASLAGAIEVENAVRVASPDRIRVSLIPDAPIRANEDLRRAKRTAVPNARGFFHFTGVTPGSYTVAASGAGVVSEPQKVVIVADREAQLRSPLRLTRPRAIRVTVVPPIDSFGDRWVIALQKQRASQQNVDRVSESPTDLDGQWTFAHAWPGEYLLRVMDERGNQWSSLDLDVTDDVDVVVPVLSVPLEGEVRLAEKPIAATLKFVGWSGARIQTRSEHDGTFKTRIPAQNDERWDVVVTAPDLGIHRTLRNVPLEVAPNGEGRVTLTLSAGQFAGKVIDEAGSVVSGALVKATGLEAGEALQWTSTSPDGTFLFNGLPPGRYRVSAEDSSKAGPRTSDVVVATVTADSDPPEELTLTMRAQKGLSGVVTSRNTPVIGAFFLAAPTDRDYNFLSTATSDTEGRFRLHLPSGTAAADILVKAPGFATRMFHQPLTRSELPVLLAQSGGRLLLRVPLWNEDDARGSHPWVLHDGAIFHARMLMHSAEWGKEDALIDAGDVDPGVYSLCIGRSDQWPAMRAGIFPCKSGIVAPFGRLELGN